MEELRMADWRTWNCRMSIIRPNFVDIGQTVWWRCEKLHLLLYSFARISSKRTCLFTTDTKHLSTAVADWWILTQKPAHI